MKSYNCVLDFVKFEQGSVEKNVIMFKACFSVYEMHKYQKNGQTYESHSTIDNPIKY